MPFGPVTNFLLAQKKNLGQPFRHCHVHIDKDNKQMVKIYLPWNKKKSKLLQYLEFHKLTFNFTVLYAHVHKDNKKKW
jgi:hypothetical protein